MIPKRKPRSKTLHLRMTVAEREILDYLASLRGRSASEHVRQLVFNEANRLARLGYLKEHGSPAVREFLRAF